MAMKSAYPSILTAAALATFPAGAVAADIPVKAPPKAVVGDYGHYYVWADGSYQEIKLPTYDLGWRRTAPVGQALDTGAAVQSHDPEATGGGFAGAIGYRLPNSFFGSNARIELGGFYVKADDSSGGPAADRPRSTLQLLGGEVGAGCVAGSCQYTSNLTTDYQAWQINLKAASDFKAGTATWTPSVAVFGGRTSYDQQLSATQNFLGVTENLYSAATQMRWTDWGAKFGLDARFDVTNWLAFGAGGAVGFAARDASLVGNDSCVVIGGGLCGGFVTGISSISTSANATPLLANAEARIFITPWRNVSLKGFAGLNYDSKVPGIRKPSFGGDAGTPTSTTAAGIRFDNETSWYAGGGLVVKFGY
jgi:hypothetical protein